MSTIPSVNGLLLLVLLVVLPTVALSWLPPPTAKSQARSSKSIHSGGGRWQAQQSDVDLTSSTTNTEASKKSVFFEFVDFLTELQSSIIDEVETMDGSGETFSKDTWGVFDENNFNGTSLSGGITRVIQGGNVVEKGACSLTLIRRGILSAERAAAIRSRQDLDSIRPGDVYSAAALSIVLHSRSPMVPTFRSDVRIFFVEADGGKTTMAWFGGGADLTPYYLFDDDVTFFHNMCPTPLPIHNSNTCPHNSTIIHPSSIVICVTNIIPMMNFPIGSEHRGTGGIFFDDMEATPDAMEFVQGVAKAWMPSWRPIVEKRNNTKYTEQQKQWQLLRRGRYLEFNLLYDRGVKFGLANANPRVEGVMVSAPPLIAFEYNHQIEEGSEEARLMDILKNPKEWATE
eukprot:scaffold22680_cov107-Cylindrotheca_fusiformis.AAC.36